MKLATFTHAGATRLGLVVGVEIVDLAAAAPDLPSSMLALLEAGEPALGRARAAEAARPRLPLAEVREEAGDPRRFVLGTGDALPKGAPQPTLHAISRAAREYGPGRLARVSRSRALSYPERNSVLPALPDPDRVQCFAARLEPEHLEQKYGRELVFWHDGVVHRRPASCSDLGPFAIQREMDRKRWSDSRRSTRRF